MINKCTISCHQTGVLAGLLLLVLKLTSLPSLMYQSNEIGGLTAIILICLFNIGVIALLVWLKKKYENLSLYDIFCGILGKFLTKAIYLVLFVFFVFKILLLVDDGFGFIRDIADEEFGYGNFAICFFPVICALAFSGIRNLSRTAEFFFPFVLIGLFVAIVFSFAPINIAGLGTFARLNFKSVFNVLAKLSFWNGDLFALFIILDKIKLKKGSIAQLFSPVIIISIFLCVAYAMYYSLYQQTAPLHSNMIFDIIEYSVGTSSGWHMDIFAIIIYMVCLYLQGGLYLFFASETIERIFNFQNKKIIFAGIVTAIMVVQFLYLNDYLKYIEFAREYLWALGLGLLLLFPLLIFISIAIKRRKNARNFRKT